MGCIPSESVQGEEARWSGPSAVRRRRFRGMSAVLERQQQHLPCINVHATLQPNAVKHATICRTLMKSNKFQRKMMLLNVRHLNENKENYYVYGIMWEIDLI